MARRARTGAIVAGGVAVFVIAAALLVPHVAAAGANGLLRPPRRVVTAAPPPGCEAASIRGAGVALSAWQCRTSLTRRATIVFLHGVADNRAASAGMVQRYLPKGFDVVSYDSRAHGESGGEFCTYGYLEKQDLGRVIETIDGPVVLIGASLGAAVALQAAPGKGQVRAIVAAECFSDLRTVARERVPRCVWKGLVDRAFVFAERRAHFPVDKVSPESAARHITVPVMLVHGRADVETMPAHSERIYAALAGPKRLLLVDGAGHNQSLGAGSTWDAIDAWLDAALAASPSR